MSSPYDTAALVTLLNNLEMVPTSQNTYDTDDFVSLINHSLQNDILPLFLSTNEEYFVKYEDFSVTTNDTYLEIPSAAIGMRARDVLWISNDGGMQTMQRIQPELLNVPMYSSQWMSTGPGYYLQQNRIVFYPRIQGNGTVRITYFRRPSILTSTDNSGTIVSIDTNANTVTLDVAPDVDTWDTGSVLDAIHNYQPFDFAEEELTVVSRAGLVFEFADVSNLSVGDVLTTTGYSVFPQYLPVEAHGLLVQAAAKKVLQGLGDADNFKVASATFMEMKDQLMKMIAPRVQGQSKKIGNAGRGILYGVGGNGRWLNNN